ncbi:hypothetical protein KKC87_03005, partial [Patescibacteria group bacterium]|nr:hypothetical protein [Patescibacteria group bacterium]
TTQIIEKTCPVVKPTIRYIRTAPITTGAIIKTTGQITAEKIITKEAGAGMGVLEILEIRRVTDPQQNLGRVIDVSGRAGSSLKIKAYIY